MQPAVKIPETVVMTIEHFSHDEDLSTSNSIARTSRRLAADEKVELRQQRLQREQNGKKQSWRVFDVFSTCTIDASLNTDNKFGAKNKRRYFLVFICMSKGP